MQFGKRCGRRSLPRLATWFPTLLRPDKCPATWRLTRASCREDNLNPRKRGGERAAPPILASLAPSPPSGGCAPHRLRRRRPLPGHDRTVGIAGQPACAVQRLSNASDTGVRRRTTTRSPEIACAL